MSIIAVVRELPGCSVSGCVGVAVARCSTAKEKKENKNVNNYLHLGSIFQIAGNKVSAIGEETPRLECVSERGFWF